MKQRVFAHQRSAATSSRRSTTIALALTKMAAAMLTVALLATMIGTGLVDPAASSLVAPSITSSLAAAGSASGELGEAIGYLFGVGIVVGGIIAGIVWLARRASKR